MDTYKVSLEGKHYSSSFYQLYSSIYCRLNNRSRSSKKSTCANHEKPHLPLTAYFMSFQFWPVSNSDFVFSTEFFHQFRFKLFVKSLKRIPSFRDASLLLLQYIIIQSFSDGHEDSLLGRML